MKRRGRQPVCLKHQGREKVLGDEIKEASRGLIVRYL